MLTFLCIVLPTAAGRPIPIFDPTKNSDLAVYRDRIRTEYLFPKTDKNGLAVGKSPQTAKSNCVKADQLFQRARQPCCKGGERQSKHLYTKEIAVLFDFNHNTAIPSPDQISNFAYTTDDYGRLLFRVCPLILQLSLFLRQVFPMSSPLCVWAHPLHLYRILQPVTWNQ